MALLFTVVILSNPALAQVSITSATGTGAVGEVSAGQVRDYLLAIIAERDRFYLEKFHAQEEFTRQATESNAHAIGATKEAVNDKFANAKEAVVKAEVAAEKRFDSINEFRAQLRDQQNTFLTKGEYSGVHKSLEEKVALLQQHIVPRDEHENRWKAQELQLAAINTKLEQISLRQFQVAGAAEGSTTVIGFVVGGLGILIALGTLAHSMLRKAA